MRGILVSVLFAQKNKRAWRREYTHLESRFLCENTEHWVVVSYIDLVTSGYFFFTDLQCIINTKTLPQLTSLDCRVVCF